MRSDVVILFEHKNRELESALMLQRVLRQRGLTAKVLHYGWDAEPLSILYRTSVLVTPWCYDDCDVKKLAHFKAINRKTLKVVNLHCEQLSPADEVQFMVPTGLALNMQHIAWGDYFRDALLKAGVAKEDIVVAGSSRLDFFRPEYRAACCSKEGLSRQFNLDPDKQWILFVGNFTLAFYSDKMVHGLNARGLPNVEENRAMTKEAYSVILHWIRCVAEQACDNIEIIYRPHPSEPVSDELSDIETSYSNFHVIKDNAIRDWFVNVDAAFTWNSTSAIEAAFAEIPVFSLRPFPIPETSKIELLENVPAIFNKEELLEVMHASADSSMTCDLSAFKKELSKFYAWDEQTATTLTADRIEAAVKGFGPDIESSFSIGHWVNKTLRFLAKCLLHYMRLGKHVANLKICDDEFITAQERRLVVDRITRVDL